MGFSAFLMSLAPLLIAGEGELDAGGWRMTAAVGLVPCVGIAISHFWWDRRLDRAGHPAQTVGALRSGQVLLFVAVVLLLAGLIGWPIEAGWHSYAIATSFLVVGCVNAISVSFWLAMRLAANGTEEP